jgi:transposase InsO family protein
MEFVRLAGLEGANRRELCRRFDISAKTGYKWLKRYESEGAISEHSRRPLHSPKQSTPAMEAAVMAVRDRHPAWGARKIKGWLANHEQTAPAHSTVHAILNRHDRIKPPPGGDRAKLRFEREEPNELWQMDFKGWVKLGNGHLLHPLTVLDDHSRFALGLEACSDQRRETVMAKLEAIFRCYGLPQAFFVDNGKPWGDSQKAQWSKLGVWLIKLGIILIHSRPYHPQSRGKNERFHRSLDAEVLDLKPLADLSQAQKAFDSWRHIYNFERPHEALDLKPPSSRYRMSARAMPAKLPEPSYGGDAIVRRISTTKTYIAFKGRNWKVPEAFAGELLAIRPLDCDGQFGVFFASHQVAIIDLANKQGVTHVSEHPLPMSLG